MCIKIGAKILKAIFAKESGARNKSATLMALAEYLKIKMVFTLDLRDFSLYHPKHIRHFDLLSV